MIKKSHVLCLVGAVLLAACGKGEPAAAGAPASHAQGRRIAVTATNEGYAPATIEAKAGEPIVLVFTRKTKSDCLAKVVFPSLAISKDLPINQPVEIAITPDKPGDIKFQCGMAMIDGAIHVTGG